MSKKTLNIDPEKIHLVFIEEISVAINDTEEANNINPSLSTNVAHLTAYNLEGGKFLFGLQLLFSTNDQPKNFECKFRFNFHFVIDNLQEMYTLNEDNQPVFQKLFVATLAGISYSTLRGIVFERTSSSNRGSLLLPVINPSDLLESWIDQD